MASEGSKHSRSLFWYIAKAVLWVVGVVVVALVGGLASPFGNRVEWTVPPKIVDPSLRGYLGTIQDNLLQAQGRRSQLVTVVRAVDNCEISPGAAIARVKEIAAERARAVNAIERVPAPDSGRSLQHLFIEAFTSADRADDTYIDWLSQVETDHPHAMPCHYETLAEYQKFVSESGTASRSKSAFASSVNPNLAAYNYTPSNWSQYNF